jgi:hypothetical protein
MWLYSLVLATAMTFIIAIVYLVALLLLAVFFGRDEAARMILTVGVAASDNLW